MAAEKKPMIVIKKINVSAAAAHGGSWKVAFADFMTAMMCFFLVMWLVNSSEEVKKSVSDYFSTPSIIEYNFSNYGVELTLEKLFLDILNEPLKAFESFITPQDHMPNFMDMGTKKIQLHFVAEQLGQIAANVDVNQDEITFDIADTYLFEKNSANPNENFVGVMEKVRALTEGLKDVDIFINSELPATSKISKTQARNVAEQRLDLILAKVESGLQGQNVDMYGKTSVDKITKIERRRDDGGTVKFRIKQKEFSKPEDEGKKSKRSVSAPPKEAPGVREAKAADDRVNNQNIDTRHPQSEGKPSKVDTIDGQYDSFVNDMSKAGKNK
jgi:chemotaxis protein MotB